jgi:hypothetical protein
MRHMLDVTGAIEDRWLFSTADDIPVVLDTVFGSSPGTWFVLHGDSRVTGVVAKRDRGCDHGR